MYAELRIPLGSGLEMKVHAITEHTTMLVPGFWLAEELAEVYRSVDHDRSAILKEVERLRAAPRQPRGHISLVQDTRERVALVGGIANGGSPWLAGLKG